MLEITIIFKSEKKNILKNVAMSSTWTYTDHTCYFSSSWKLFKNGCGLMEIKYFFLKIRCTYIAVIYAHRQFGTIFLRTLKALILLYMSRRMLLLSLVQSRSALPYSCQWLIIKTIQ